MKRLLSLLVASTALLGAGSAMAQERLLTLGTAVTETVFALGEESKLVGRDTTSTYPEAAAALPDVGYVRQLAPEGVLSVSPDMIIAEEDAGPVETIDVLKAASIPWISLPKPLSGEGALANIRAIGEALGKTAEAETIAAALEADLASAAEKSAAITTKKRVLFVLSTQGGRVMAAGTGTSADVMIDLAGGVNAVTGLEGYKQLTDEAITAAAPDVILMMDRGQNLDASNDELFKLASLATTPAGQAQAVIRIDGSFLLGFGPRTGQAALALHEALYGAN